MRAMEKEFRGEAGSAKGKERGIGGIGTEYYQRQIHLFPLQEPGQPGHVSGDC